MLPLLLTVSTTIFATPTTLQSTELTAQIDNQFPRVIQYTWKSNRAVFYAQEDTLNKIKVNGTLYTPTVQFTHTTNQGNYTLGISPLNISINIKIAVVGNVLEWKVTSIQENGSSQLKTLEIPDHNLISVRSGQSGAAFSGNRMYTKVAGTGDTFVSATGSPIVDTSAQGYMYGLLNHNQLSAGIWSNSVYDKPSATQAKENRRVLKQTVNKNAYFRTGLWSGSWLYRAEGSSETEPLPMVKIAFAPDLNGDSMVNWQDAAIAFRKIMNNPQGSEGHDSAHPDYGNVGKRQDGAADLNFLIEKGHLYNAYFGVHINAQESYPEAKAFNEVLVNPNRKDWSWLDQAYIINKRNDANSGRRLARLQELKTAVPNLDFIYLDVWYQDGWESRKVAREINAKGWTLFTEFPDRLEYDQVWSHWSVDYDYGGKYLKGLNSQIVRFIRNHQKDNWIARHPLLGGTEIRGYEG